MSDFRAKPIIPTAAMGIPIAGRWVSRVQIGPSSDFAAQPILRASNVIASGALRAAKQSRVRAVGPGLLRRQAVARACQRRVKGSSRIISSMNVRTRSRMSVSIGSNQSSKSRQEQSLDDCKSSPTSSGSALVSRVGLRNSHMDVWQRRPARIAVRGNMRDQAAPFPPPEGCA
jgi:hypothetical protein